MADHVGVHAQGDRRVSVAEARLAARANCAPGRTTGVDDRTGGPGRSGGSGAPQGKPSRWRGHSALAPSAHSGRPRSRTPPSRACHGWPSRRTQMCGTRPGRAIRPGSFGAYPEDGREAVCSSSRCSLRRRKATSPPRAPTPVKKPPIGPSQLAQAGKPPLPPLTVMAIDDGRITCIGGVGGA